MKIKQDINLTPDSFNSDQKLKLEIEQNINIDQITLFDKQDIDKKELIKNILYFFVDNVFLCRKLEEINKLDELLKDEELLKYNKTQEKIKSYKKKIDYFIEKYKNQNDFEFVFIIKKMNTKELLFKEESSIEDNEKITFFLNTNFLFSKTDEIIDYIIENFVYSENNRTIINKELGEYNIKEMQINLKLNFY